jgi:hypothetical protein
MVRLPVEVARRMTVYRRRVKAAIVDFVAGAEGRSATAAVWIALELESIF